jgi:plastocyanin
MRRAALFGAGVLLAAGLPAIAVSSAGASDGPPPKAATVKIEGTDIYVRNRSMITTYHFPDEPTRVAPGGTITFVNKTNDGHNMSLIAAKDLPIPEGRLVVDSFNICPLCDAISGAYFTSPGGNSSPAGAQIDNGKLTDDDTVPDDADIQDPAVPPGVTPPFPVLVADFDTVSHTNPTGPATVGDSTLVDANGPANNGFVTQRTVKMSAVPGTYHYICTFHPWMQGTIVVGPSGDR